MRNDSQCNLIDPDPFTIAGLAIASAAFVLQFVQVYRDWNKSSSQPTLPPAPQATPQQLIEITHIRTELSMARQHFKSATRAVERGSSDVEGEFYEAKLRVSATSMKLDSTHHQQFSMNLGQSFARFGNTSMFINNMIAHHPSLAAQIGKSIAERVPDAANQLNELMAEGGQTRRVLSESNRVLDAFEDVIKKLDEGN